MQYIFLEDGLKPQGHYVQLLTETISKKFKKHPKYRQDTAPGKVSILLNNQVFVTATGASYREGKQLAAKKGYDLLTQKFPSLKNNKLIS